MRSRQEMERKSKSEEECVTRSGRKNEGDEKRKVAMKQEYEMRKRKNKATDGLKTRRKLHINRSKVMTDGDTKGFVS